MRYELILKILFDEEAIDFAEEVVDFLDLQAKLDRDFDSNLVDREVILIRVITVIVCRVTLARHSIATFEFEDDSLYRRQNQLLHVVFEELLTAILRIW